MEKKVKQRATRRNENDIGHQLRKKTKDSMAESHDAVK